MSLIKYLKYPIYVFVILGINNCGSSGFNGTEGAQDNGAQGNAAGKSQYDIYFCSYVSVGSTDSRAGIYGMNRNNLENITKIIDLDGKIVDSCTLDGSGNIYWGDRNQKAILKSDPHGNNIKKIVSGLDIPYRGLAVDEKRKRLYWSNWLGNSSPQSGEIGYSNLDGSNKKIIMNNHISGGSFVIDTQNDTFYMADLFGNYIIRSDMEGKNPVKVADVYMPKNITIDTLNKKFLWSERKSNQIYKMDLTGTINKQPLDTVNTFERVTLMAFDKKENRLYYVAFENFDENLYYYDMRTKEKVFVKKLPGEVVGLVVAK